MENKVKWGFAAPVYTAFNSDWSVNTEIVPKYAKYLSDEGVPGVLVNGTNGEGPLLSVQERKETAEAWVAAAKHTNQHVMVQVGGAPLPDVLELTRHAEKIGVSSILCLPELYFKPKTPQELIDYLKIVSEAAPNIPLLYYHNPKMSGVNLNMEVFLKLAVNQLPTLHGIKFSSNELSEGYDALKAVKDKYVVFFGGGANTLIQPTLTLGCYAVISTSLNVMPGRLVKIAKAIKENRIDDATAMQEEVSAICKAATKYGSFLTSMKTAMSFVTPINVGLSRAPLKNLTEDQQREMKSEFQNIFSK